MKKISLLLAVALILSSLSVSTVFAAADIVIAKDAAISIVTGKTYTHMVTVRNDSAKTARNIQLQIFTSGISVVSNITAPFELAPGESYDISLEIFGENGIGSYNRDVTLNFVYRLNDDTLSSQSSPTFRVNVTDQQGSIVEPETDNRKPNVIMTAPTSVITLPPGGSRTIEAVFKNAGNTAANNLVIVPASSENFQLNMKDAAGSNATLTVNSSRSVSVTVTSDKSLKKGSYPVVFNYTYYDAQKKSYTGTSTFYVKIEDGTSAANPNLVLKNFDITPDNVVGGNQFTLSANIENTSDTQADNCQVTISGLDASVISMANAANNTYFDKIKAKEIKTVSFNLKTNEKLKTNSYPIILTVKYNHSDTEAGKTDFSSEYTYYVSVLNKDGEVSDENKAVLSVISTSAPKGTYDTGQEFPVSMTIINNGRLEAKNVKITATAPEGVVPKSSNVQQILSLAPNASKALNFSFAPNADSQTQNYTIEFKIEYENGLEETAEGVTTKEKDSFVQYIGANIVNSKADEEKDEDEKMKSIPKIIVSSYKVDPIIVQAGQEFDLYLTFQNTHATKTISNIKALLTVPVNNDGEKTENAFSPVNASNTFFIDSIGPKSTHDEYVRLYSVPDAVAKNHVLIIQFDYEDEDGNAITQSEEVGVTIRQISNLEVGDIPMQTNGFVNEPIYLSFSLQNTGKVTLNNLKIKVVGDAFMTVDAEVILGNFASGDHTFYDGQFIPQEQGEHPVQVIISYDESTGEHVEKVYDFTIFVEEMIRGEDSMGMNGPMGMDGVIIGPDGMPIEEATGLWGFIKTNWIWIAAGAVVTIAVAATTVIIIRKRKKGLDLDE